MVSLGEELKRARELREITLREISDATKISVRILEAIENNNYKILPGGIFNRNFLRAYAGFIGLDPEMIVRKYQQQEVITTEEQGPYSAMVSIPEGDKTPPRKRKGMVLLVVLLVLLLLLASVFLFTRNRWFKTGGPAQTGSLIFTDAA